MIAGGNHTATIGGICAANDEGSALWIEPHSPSHGLRRDSPLKEGAGGGGNWAARIQCVPYGVALFTIHDSLVTRLHYSLTRQVSTMLDK